MSKLLLNTNDKLSRSTDLEITVSRTLNRIRFEHKHDEDYSYVFYLSASDVEKLSLFLSQCNEWIKSGYKPKLVPKT